MKKFSIVFTITFLFLFILIQKSLAVPFCIDGGKNAIAHNERGLFYYGQGYYEAAINEFYLGIILTPNPQLKGVLQNNLGKVYLELEDTDKAIENFAKAIDLNPDFMEYYKNLASAYARKNIDKSIKTYQKLIKTDSKNFRAWIVLGFLYEEKKNTYLRNLCFEKAIEIQPESILADGLKQKLEP